MIFIKYLLLVVAAAPYLGLAVKFSGDGLNVCDNSACMNDGVVPDLDSAAALNITSIVCTNLVGKNSDLAYVKDERRSTCFQATTGDGAYKYDFDVHRNKCSDAADKLDHHSCLDAVNNILHGWVTWCGVGSEWVVGGREQVGCFDVYVSAHPGLCAGSYTYSI